MCACVVVWGEGEWGGQRGWMITRIRIHTTRARTCMTTGHTTLLQVTLTSPLPPHRLSCSCTMVTHAHTLSLMFSQVELQLHHLPGLFSANMDAKLSELRAELAAVMTHHLRKVGKPAPTQCNIASRHTHHRLPFLC